MARSLPGLIHVVPSCLVPHKKSLQPVRAFILYAALLRQAFAHCGKFLAAASRRSLDRVSVPVWPYTLSGRLPVIGLVGFYPANYLMGRSHLQLRIAAFPPEGLSGITRNFLRLSPSIGQLTTCYSPVRRYAR